MAVQFKTPPRQPARTEARENAMLLRENPGVQGVIRTYPREQMRAAHNYAQKINAGKFPAYVGCRARAVSDGPVTEVWAEYVGEES